MPAQTITQPASASTSKVSQKSSKAQGSEAPQDAQAFAQFLQHSLGKKSAVPASAKAPIAEFGAPSKAEPGNGGIKVPKALSVLGEVEEEDGKNPLLKLSDILAQISHESSAPEGTQIINLKTVLGAKNDDPDLINQDLIALMPKADQKQAVKTLINGAKAELKEILQSRIPKDRVPHTLKGLVEMAIRFNIPVEDIKLETLPKSKLTEEMLTRFKVSTKGVLPPPSSKIALETPKQPKSNAKQEEHKEHSPLEKLLSGQKAPVAASSLSHTAKEPLKKVLKQDKDEKVAKLDPKDKELNSLDTKPQALAKTEDAGKAAQNKPKLETLLAHEAHSSETELHELSESSTKENEPVHTTHKSEALRKEGSLELKMAESRQLVSQLSKDIKEAMEQYKPPFTKLSMKLKPERLGEIDVSMVQRGNSVHINLSSNPVALNLLQNNAAELKEALAQAGLGDSSMNFSEHKGQGHEHKQHTTHEKYQEMAQLAEGDIEMLELVVPRYG